jgi:hypothetical protein
MRLILIVNAADSSLRGASELLAMSDVVAPVARSVRICFPVVSPRSSYCRPHPIDMGCSWLRAPAILSLLKLREKAMNNLRQIARAGRAETLAWKTLESLTLGAADDDEKTRRKLHLIKGPEEFQGIRIDQPPAPSLENKRSHANCGPMTQQGMMGAHGREMYPQGFLRLTGCHKSNRQKEDAASRA